jgi:tRNA 5-methylaminomethyl-2-thiouridine biosynthesis bifunctional protein
MPRLDRGGDHAEMHLAGFVHAVRLYEQLNAFESCGVREAPGARDLAALADLAQDPPLPSEWLSASDNGLFHARAGLVDTRAVIEALTAASKVSIARIGAIVRKDAAWRLCDDAGKVVDEVEAVIIATGASLKRFKESDWLPLRLSRGQIEWAKDVQLQTGVSSGAFAAPFRGGVLFGATFDHVETELSVQADEQSRKRNLAALMRLAPDVAGAVHGEQLVSRVALRASTPDFAPLAGLMPDSQLWLSQNAGVALGRNPPALEAPSLKGLYIFGGLGARGFTLAPMLAESLASELCGEPPPLSRPTLDTIHPARFLLRALKKKEGISDYP